MKTLGEISKVLRLALKRKGSRQIDLREDAGISQRTLTNVLSGDADYKLTTLMAIADRLDLELVLVPKVAALAVAAGATAKPRIKSRVQAALDRLHAKVK